MSDDLFITDENIEDMIDASNYGITYWAEALTSDEWENASEDTIMGFAEVEGSERVVHFVTAQQIRDAFHTMIVWGNLYVNERIHGYFLSAWAGRDENGIDAGEIDSEAGDVLIQMAIFDKVIYG